MPSILILEDDITFSLMLKTWLGRKGFEVSSVSSVSDARSRIEDASFDLILSDLRLPDGDGIDLLKWIKENNFVIPLIMMTSYAEIQTAVQAIKLGASDYIAKPLNPEELLGKIKDVIKTKQVRLLLLPNWNALHVQPNVPNRRGERVASMWRDRAKLPTSSMSMYVWLLRQICLC